MLKIGITGGIGSGKSTVCRVWQSLGAFVIYADDLAKSLMANDKNVKGQLVEAFGKECFHSDGSLNRKYLADEAFHKGRTEELNKIVHPAVIDEVKRKISDLQQQDYNLMVYEAALMLQNGRPAYLNKIVLVLADEEKRIARVAARDEVDKKSIIDRINRQQDFELLSAQVDVIIRNNGTEKELELKARDVYQKLTDKNN